MQLFLYKALVHVSIPNMGAIKNIRHQQAGRNYKGGDRELWISQGQC